MLIGAFVRPVCGGFILASRLWGTRCMLGLFRGLTRSDLACLACRYLEHGRISLKWPLRVVGGGDKAFFRLIWVRPGGQRAGQQAGCLSDEELPP